MRGCHLHSVFRQSRGPENAPEARGVLRLEIDHFVKSQFIVVVDVLRGVHLEYLVDEICS